MRIVLAQDVGALHSRTIENRIAVAKSAKARRFLLIALIIARGSFGAGSPNH